MILLFLPRIERGTLETNLMRCTTSINHLNTFFFVFLFLIFINALSFLVLFFILYFNVFGFIFSVYLLQRNNKNLARFLRIIFRNADTLSHEFLPFIWIVLPLLLIQQALDKLGKTRSILSNMVSNRLMYRHKYYRYAISSRIGLNCSIYFVF